MRSWMVVVLLLASGCASPPEVEGVHARRGTIRESFTEPAETRLARTWTVSMPVEGRIARVDLDAGDAVRKGQPLARFDRLSLRARANEAASAVDEVEARLAEGGDLSTELAQRDQALAAVRRARSGIETKRAEQAAAQVRLAHARLELGRAEELYRRGAVARSALDDARLDERTAALAVEQARASLRELQADVEAQLEAVRVSTSRIEHRELEQQVLREQLRQARERSLRESHEASLAVVRSPIDGVVLERYLQGPAEVAAGTPLLLLGNLRDLEVMAEVLTTDAMRLRAGTLVEMRASAGSPVVLGRVKRIEPAGFTKRSSLGVEQKRVRVYVRLAARPPSMGAGYRLEARFITARRDDALLIPFHALLQEADGTFQVQVARDGRLRRQAVRLGLRGDFEVEVLGGLLAQDVLVSMPDASMADGSTIRLREIAGWSHEP